MNRLYTTDLLIWVRCGFWQTTLNVLGGPFKKRKEKGKKSFHLIYCKRFHLNKGQLCCSSSCKNIPSSLGCLKRQFLYRFPTCLQKRRTGLLSQNFERKKVTSTVFGKWNCIQTVMNLGSQVSSGSCCSLSELWSTHHFWPVPRRMNLRKSIFEMPGHASLPSWKCTTSSSNFQGQNRWDLHSKAVRPNQNPGHSRWLPRRPEIKVRVHGPGRPVGATQGGAVCGTEPARSRRPPARGAGVGCSWDQSVAWMCCDEPSRPICGSHTVVPRSRDLIIIYQKYLIRDVGGERWPRNCTLLNLNVKPASFLPGSVFAISHLGWLHLPNKCF